MLGVYVPGIIFSIIDVFVTKRLTLKQSAAIYWRAMKWYSTFYIIAMPVFLLVPLPIKLNVPANAPTLIEFCFFQTTSCLNPEYTPSAASSISRMCRQSMQ